MPRQKNNRGRGKPAAQDNKKTRKATQPTVKPKAAATKKATATKPKKATQSVKTTEDNTSSRYPNGRTLKTQDKYLPEGKGAKTVNPKANRRVVIIDSNKNDELAVVKLTTSKSANTSPLPSYKQGNGKPTRFKHFVETQDDEGKPIKVDGEKFKENPWDYDLTPRQVGTVKKRVLEHVPQAQENNKKIADLKDNGKKGKKKR